MGFLTRAHLLITDDDLMAFVYTSVIYVDVTMCTIKNAVDHFIVDIVKSAQKSLVYCHPIETKYSYQLLNSIFHHIIMVSGILFTIRYYVLLLSDKTGNEDDVNKCKKS